MSVRHEEIEIDNQPAFSAIILVIVMISIIGHIFSYKGKKSNQELMNSLSEKSGL